MAKRPGTDDGMLPSPTALREFAADLNAADVNMDSGDGAVEVSLEEILKLYSQPINEEQAWAVCYQCCRTLAQRQRRKSSKSAGASAVDYPRRIEGPGDVRIGRDGTIKLHFEDGTGKRTETCQVSRFKVILKHVSGLSTCAAKTTKISQLPTMNHFPSHHWQAKPSEHPHTEAILLWLSAFSHVVNLFTDTRCVC